MRVNLNFKTKMKKLITLTALLLTHIFVFAQKEHKTFYENGNIEIQGQFDENGKPTGEWKYYEENGKVESIEHFSENRIFRKSYWQNGRLQEVGTFFE